MLWQSKYIQKDFHAKCTKKFAEEKIAKIKEIRKWLNEKLKKKFLSTLSDMLITLVTKAGMHIKLKIAALLVKENQLSF